MNDDLFKIGIALQRLALMMDEETFQKCKGALQEVEDAVKVFADHVSAENK